LKEYNKKLIDEKEEYNEIEKKWKEERELRRGNKEDYTVLLEKYR
jgi:hypothetical protein